MRTRLAAACSLALCLLSIGFALANGGPFAIRYPDGDPAAKGILARIDPALKPRRETVLRVVKEDLTFLFQQGREMYSDPGGRQAGPPRVRVSAKYTIENPTDKPIQVDFGFPILRGVYMDPHSMVPRPEVEVWLGPARIECDMITNSLIYAIIRQNARETIERALQADPALRKLVMEVHDSADAPRIAARNKLRRYLAGKLKWDPRDTELMVEYAGITLEPSNSEGPYVRYPSDRSYAYFPMGEEASELLAANMGPVAAIGEQKATQFLARLASCFDPKVASTYEAIFTAWGGDVRERSVDMNTGKVRPREITVKREPGTFTKATIWDDPTVYARVDYLDPSARLSDDERKACRNILKNLPVVFTFAPMNLLHYQVSFPAKSTQTLTVNYGQFAYLDTKAPSSYQLAYVVHPASLWKSFGPINLEVLIPEGAGLKSSIPCTKAGVKELNYESAFPTAEKGRYTVYKGTVKDKTGEIFLATDAATWHKMYMEPANNPPSAPKLLKAPPGASR